MKALYKIVHYTEFGKDIFQDWLDNLRDLQGRAAIVKAVDRIEAGNFGVHRFCRDNVWEIVIDKGPGYRVYYSLIQNLVVLLLCAGDKKTQQKDINKAVEFLKKFKEEHS